MSKLPVVEVARIGLMSLRKSVAPAAIERKARRLLEQLQAMGAMPVDLEVCEFAHEVLARDSQLWISLQVRPRAQQVLAVGTRPPRTPEEIRKAVERDARAVRSALANVPIEAELAIARIQSLHDALEPLAGELADACIKAVHDLAGRSIEFEVVDESFRVQIPGFERTYLDPERRRITAVVDGTGQSSITLSAVAEIEPSIAAQASPLPNKLVATTALVDRPDRFDPILLRSMRQRCPVAATVRALRCSITGCSLAAALVGAGND